jgi:hypothetical protein
VSFQNSNFASAFASRVPDSQTAATIRDRQKERLGTDGGWFVKSDKLRNLTRTDAFASASLYSCNKDEHASVNQMTTRLFRTVVTSDAACRESSRSR